MVNTGRPSRGCATCKLRRKKCDERRPECGQCKTRGLKCPGIPQLADVLFRDETKRLQQQRQSATVSTSWKGVRTKSEQFQNALPDALDFELDRTINSIGYKANDAALSAFLSNCEQSVKAPVAWQNTWHQIVLDNSTQSFEGRTFTPAMHAFCLHHVAIMTQDRRMLQLAASYYGKALTEMRNAIRDPKKAVSNDTLLNGVLMWAYESKAARTNTRSLDTHLDAAAIILDQQGNSQDDSREGRLLLYASLEQIIYNHSRRLKPLPEIVASTSELLLPSSNDTPITRLGMRATKVPGLRARAKEVFQDQSSTDVEYLRLLSDAIHIDSNLARWLEDLPSQLQGPFRCQYGRQSSPHAEQTISTASRHKFYVYPATPLAIFYSRYYLYRLYVLKILERCQGYLGLIDGQHKSTQMIETLNSDLCATLPSAVGYRYCVSDSQNLLKSIWPGEHANAAEDGTLITNMLHAIRDANLDECFEDKFTPNSPTAEDLSRLLHLKDIETEYSLPREYRTPVELSV